MKWLLLLWLLPASAFALTLEGPLTQGSLVTGHIEKGANVTLDGETISVHDGMFYLGFGRDAAPEAQLHITYTDGKTTTQTLEINQRQYDIQNLKLPDKMVSPPDSVQSRIARENGQIVAARSKISTTCYFKGTLARPSEGKISGVYGSQRILNGVKKRPHFGLDIAAPIGAPVIAPLAGTVSLAAPEMYYTGNTVMIDHGCGVSTLYIHLSKMDVKPGQHVEIGDKIGEVGKTGRATGPHLHWGLSLGNMQLDPQLFLFTE